MSKDLWERLEAADLRIDRSITLAGAIGAYHALSDDLEDFLESAEKDTIERCLGPLPNWLDEALDSGGADDEVSEWLLTSKKVGWLLGVTTPVKSHHATGATFSWGWCHSTWIYGDTFDEAVDRALAWVAECRAEERTKKVPAKGRRTRSRKS